MLIYQILCSFLGENVRNKGQFELCIGMIGIRTPKKVNVDVQNLVIAGWTGRDKAAIARHIEELEAIGVARPKRTPMFYRVAADRLTTEPVIDVIGNASTGEVEFVVLQKGRELYVGVGSDHTDRKAETFGVTVSKQMCPKPIARQFWQWRDVGRHWDELTLRCIATVKGRKVLYQEGSVTAMLHPQQLLARYEKASRKKFLSGTIMFCGTLAAKNKISWAEQYDFELHDPVLKRTLQHSYRVRSLPVVD